MQEDFHYYATYCAAWLAGYPHEESLAIAYAAQLPDLCTRTFLSRIQGPLSAATTQLQMEMMDAPTDPVGLQDITRIWASFHFLPGNLYADDKKATRRYLRKYRLICRPNGTLLEDTVNLAMHKPLPAVGLAMHILADTWAHQGFAGTPSYVINNTTDDFIELLKDGDDWVERPIRFRHNPGAPDDIENALYTNTIGQMSESSIMTLGHGRAGHLPDYSFIRYKYLPAWADYEEIVKDNPSDYYHAFAQMIYALRILRIGKNSFERDHYAWETVSPCEDTVRAILEKRQLDASDDWKAFARQLSGADVEDFDLEKYVEEYTSAPADQKNDTYLGQFFLAALAQKSMVTNRIFMSGSLLAGFSVDYQKKGFRGIRDYAALLYSRNR